MDAIIVWSSWCSLTIFLLHADDTIFYIPSLQSNNVYITFTTASTTSHLQHEINSITRWTSTNNMKLNVKKTKEFTVSFSKNQQSLLPRMVNNQCTQDYTYIIRSYVDLSYWLYLLQSKLNVYTRTLRRSGVPHNDLRSVYSMLF